MHAALKVELSCGLYARLECRKPPPDMHTLLGMWEIHRLIGDNAIALCIIHNAAVDIEAVYVK